MTGFTSILPQLNVDYFTPQELDQLVSGSSNLDLEDWMANTNYVNYNPEDTGIGWFWDFVRGSDADMRKRVLMFVTGSTRLPQGGFGRMRGGIDQESYPFTIIRAQGDGLPSSHTCFNQIEIPGGYTNAEEFRHKFAMAVMWSGGFDETGSAGQAGPSILI